MNYDPNPDAVRRMMERARQQSGAAEPTPESTEVERQPIVEEASASQPSEARLRITTALTLIILLGFGTLVVWIRRYEPDRPLSEREAWVQTSVQKLQASDASLPGLDLEKPPVRDDHRMDFAELQYCAAESIRIVAAKNAATAAGQATTLRLEQANLMVEDYNNRCGSYRATTRDRANAGYAMWDYTAALEEQGRRRLTPAPGALAVRNDPSAPPAAAPGGRQTIPTPDLSDLSTEQRARVETACEESRERGPDKYSLCLGVRKMMYQLQPDGLK